MEKITYNILLTEYQIWISEYKNGRNEEDLRFGQYLHINYDMSNVTDVFHKESATEVFNILVKDLF